MNVLGISKASRLVDGTKTLVRAAVTLHCSVEEFNALVSAFSNAANVAVKLDEVHS